MVFNVFAWLCVFLRFMWVGHTWCVPSQSAVVSWRKVWWFFTCPVKSWQNTSTSWSWADWTSAQNRVPSAACLLPWRVVANRRPPRVNISIRSGFSLVVHSVVTMWNSVSKLWIRMTLFAKRLSWVSKLSISSNISHRFSAQSASLSGVLNATRPGTKAWSVETTGKETGFCVTGPASSNTARGTLKSVHAAR